MTTAERAQLAGDVIAILGAGLGAEITDINGRFLAGAESSSARSTWRCPPG